MPVTTFDRAPRALPAMPLAAPLSLRLSPHLFRVGLGLLLLVLLVAALRWQQPMLNQLQVEGRFQRVTPESVRRVSAMRLAQGFFSVDLAQIRQDVAELPWVQRARVERVWPAGVLIRVWEREPFARWNDAALLDTQSASFTPEADDLQDPKLVTLPRLGGTPGNEKLVSDTYRQMADALAGSPLALAGLQLDARGEWTAQTRRGIELRLGPGNAADKLPVLRGALPAALGERLGEVAYVDLRYTNGFAIGWAARNRTDAAGSAASSPGRASARSATDNGGL